MCNITECSDAMMDLVAECECNCHPENSLTSTASLIQTLAVTILVAMVFVFAKTTYDHMRHAWSRVTVVIVGAGPIGLTSVLIAAQSGKADRIILYEEKCRNELFSKPQQIALDSKSVGFLRTLGVDFDNIEGCWDNNCFFMRIGVFQEYMLSIFPRLGVHIDVRLKTKFVKDCLRELDGVAGRLVAVVCDGASGRAGSLLGLSDEFVHHSCRAYGAVSAVDRLDQPSVPTPEIRVHNLIFDLHAYGNDCDVDPYPQGFHLKIFGSARHRYMALAVLRGESKLVKALKVVLDQSVMRNIFQVCFNTYKNDGESDISDKEALRNLKFSPRLFEIKISQRMEHVAYVEDANIFVVTEGEAARRCNFHSGLDVNLGIRGLQSLQHFIQLAASAESETAVLSALQYKFAHARSISHDFMKTGLLETMYT